MQSSQTPQLGHCDTCTAKKSQNYSGLILSDQASTRMSAEKEFCNMDFD